MLKKFMNDYDNQNEEIQITQRDDTPVNTNSNKESTIIGEHISIEGTVHANEDLILQGTLNGAMKLNKHHITIGSKAKVKADIFAASMTISGNMEGNVTINGKVEITKEADFTGKIKAKRIAIEDGAYVKASIEMERPESHRKNNKPMDAVVLNKDNLNTKQSPVTAK